jgi:hypothetical protein
MSFQAILLPVFVQVGLTFALLIWMGTRRLRALSAGKLKIEDIALGEPRWPARETQGANAFNNQFQVPLLFYVLVILALITRKADLLFVVMAWIFVALRIVHALIHTSTNDVRQRFTAFLAGVIVLMAMWVVFAARILAAGV